MARCKHGKLKSPTKRRRCKGTELEELDNDELEELGITDPKIDEDEEHTHE